MRTITTPVAVGLTLMLAGCASGLTTLDYRRAQTHRDLADLKLQKGELGYAVREYHASAKIDPRNAETYFGLGETYRRQGRFPQAEAEFKRAVKLDPDHQDAAFNLGVVYIQQERWDAAIALNTELLQDPSFLRPARALVNRGWALYKSGDLVGAGEDFEEALASNGSDAHAHLNLGLVRYAQGETLDSMVHFQRVLEVAGARPLVLFGALTAQARFHLAQAHVKLGQRDKAIHQLRMASDKGDGGEWARKSREYLRVLQ